MRRLSVNALSRAPLISTVPSGNPLFSRLPRSVFVSNSQNILTIRIFSLFFWLDHFLVKFYIHPSYRYLNYIILRLSEYSTILIQKFTDYKLWIFEDFLRQYSPFQRCHVIIISVVRFSRNRILRLYPGG